MEVLIIADNESVRQRIAVALDRSHCEGPTRTLSAKDLDPDCSKLSNFGGIVFLGFADLAETQFEVLRRVRRACRRDAKLVVVSAIGERTAVIQAVRCGASDFICADQRLDLEIRDFIKRARSERQSSDASSHVVTIVPCHGSSDANLLAVNVAAVVASRLGLCGLLDYNFRGGDLALLLKLNPRHTLLDLLLQRDGVDEVMLKQAAATHDSGIRLLAGPNALVDLREIRAQACQQLIDTAKRCWPVVVVNTEDIEHAALSHALAMSNQIVLTTRLDIASLARTQKNIEFLRSQQLDCQHVEVVAMGTGHSGELPVAAVEKALQVARVHVVPDDPAATIMSINLGNPMVLELPNAKPSKAIVRFVDAALQVARDKANRNERRSLKSMKAAAMFALNTLPMCK